MSRERISTSGLLLPPNHCNAFSVRGRAAMMSKFLQELTRFAFNVAGSSKAIVMRERKRI
jgi:hypothetical protein